MKKEYINGNKQNGIKYDYNEINKLFKSLNIPKEWSLVKFENAWYTNCGKKANI